MTPSEMQKLLGWVGPKDRTKEQEEAHDKAVRGMPKFVIEGHRSTANMNVRLFDLWSKPEVVADVGFVFPRFHQLTGSCVGAGGGQALFSLISVQRLIADTPTKAFIPFWPFDYGLSRSRGGMNGQGEGSMGSSFAEAVAKDGVIDANTAGLPKFENNDGLVLTSRLEMEWSDGRSNTVTSHLEEGRVHPVGTAAQMNGVEDIRAAVGNGYPITFACNNYIGNASVQGSGAEACLIGEWDGRGGHQQSIHAVWDHPTFGPLYWAQNNWPGQSYPKDPAGGPVCGCWVKEAKVSSAMRMDGEVYALSHLNWFPAQPKLLDWLI